MSRPRSSPQSQQLSRPRCAIYTRESRSRPGVVSSCETQRAICIDFVTEQRLAVDDERFDDLGESSETLERPALRKLIEKVERGEVERIVVYSIDRLTRKLYDLHKLLDLFEQHDVDLSVVTDPNFGESAAHRLTSNIVAAASEFQFELTRERMTDARRALKRQGRRVAGRVPFGYRADTATKQLVVEPTEANVVRRMFDLAAEDGRPQEIADRFNQENVVGASGRAGRWTARQILKMLSNPIYSGAIHDGDSTLPGCHEAIVTPSIFDKVRASIEARRSRTPGRTTTTINWPLRGLLVCGVCGRVMSPTVSGYKNFEYRYYRCRSRALGRPPCKDVGVSAYQIEEFVRTTLSSETWQLADPATTAPAQEFATAWHELDERQQSSALANVLSEVVFNPHAGAISLSLHVDCSQRVRQV
ncbi:MAG TPA: recombinase family protein [Pirellulaceae bacterium]|nr:recombinase family protein [Pirellulaceae bacterium]